MFVYDWTKMDKRVIKIYSLGFLDIDIFVSQLFCLFLVIVCLKLLNNWFAGNYIDYRFANFLNEWTENIARLLWICFFHRWFRKKIGIVCLITCYWVTTG